LCNTAVSVAAAAAATARVLPSFPRSDSCSRCLLSAQVVPSLLPECAGSQAPAAGFQLGTVSIMHIDVKLRGASRLSRTSSGRVMAGVFKTNNVLEQRQMHRPSVRAAFKGAALRRSLDTCEFFGALALKIIKHSTCRRRLAVAAEVRARMHPWLWSAPHPPLTPHLPTAVPLRSQCQARPTTAAATENGSASPRRAASSRPACVREYIHGVENEPYVRRLAARRASTAKTTISGKRVLNERLITSSAPRCGLHRGPALRSGRAPIRSLERAWTMRERPRRRTQRVLF
jgi:hypothetical protein